MHQSIVEHDAGSSKGVIHPPTPASRARHTGRRRDRYQAWRPRNLSLLPPDATSFHLSLHHTVHIARMIFRLGSASFDLVLLKPILYTLLSTVLLFLALPLTILGVITTVCSLSILLLRGLFVYSGLPVALVSAWLSPPVVVTMPQQGRRPSSSASGVSLPIHAFDNSDSGGEEYDYAQEIAAYHNTKVTEMTNNHQESEDAEDDNALWSAISSALQIPVDGIRERKPSLTNGATARERWAFDLVDLHRSPTQSRVRTPYAAPDSTDYFHSPPTDSPPRRTSNGPDTM